MTPRKPDSRANSGVISGNPMGLIESTSISPPSIRYRAPILTWGRVHIRTLQVISPRRTPSRSRLVNTMKRVYNLRRLQMGISASLSRTPGQPGTTNDSGRAMLGCVSFTGRTSRGSAPESLDPALGEVASQRGGPRRNRRLLQRLGNGRAEPFLLQDLRIVAACDEMVGRTPWSAADALVGPLWMRLCWSVRHATVPARGGSRFGILWLCALSGR
jgi:hypothetical protein